ncbi:MAG: ATP-dependent zinc metalloprotease FtsH [SAR202 cluster bacterium]|jgi:cell division protease FtsH|nr:cell division protein FtsH [Chloroflexota bacterium]MDP7231928.1 ATP-dependent zinc metalloprotease FtsH [Dehalococcoidia bacterium]MDP7613107.1 ATP-dependent zinc metalloprotease FtsH [Dehalococcoidia bacterium]MQG47277.1 ATP-dependent zinc metalloprotease FtsH [SAR202 cluster bacterium]|tara:strand:- start:2681 stop:4615 length:1935 start_codon:yes stop_codon:yes gene_type:complete
MKNNRWVKNITVYAVMVVAALVVFYMFFSNSNSGIKEIGINEVPELARNRAKSSQVRVEVNGDNLKITDGVQSYKSRKESGSSIAELMSESGINPSNYVVIVKGASGLSSFFGVIVGFLPLILFGGLLFFMMRQAQGGTNQTFSFGKSRARMFSQNKATVTFFDVAGVPEAKEELEEVVEFLKYPERFQALGARIPRGVLLIGPPGTGKTLLARAVAGEAGVPFFSISGSEFVEMFVGVGASRVRDLFEQAKRHSPCIVFVDEIDAVGRHRGAGLGGGNDEREQTLNQILVEMDGFDTSVNVIVIAATNRPDILDPALLRPGRFDRRVTVDNPDVKGRTEILDVHAKGKPLEESADLSDIAKQTPGFTGADLANLINEGALLAARKNQTKITTDNLTEAIDRVSMGPAKKTKVISEKDRKLTAYHEAGHGLVSHFVPAGRPVAKISIVSRGHAGGFTRWEQEDQSYYSRDELEAQITAAMGGRSAEVMKCGDITTGASNDFEQATAIAREMIMRYGMSDRLTHRSFGRRQETIFLGREMSEERNYSLKTEQVIDSEIDRLLKKGEDKANEILNTHEDILDTVANFLLEHETLDHDQFRDIVEGKIPIIKEIDKNGKNKESNEGETLTNTDLQNKKPGPKPQATS